MNEGFFQLCADEFAKHVDELFDREIEQALAREPPLGHAPIIGTLFDAVDEDAIAKLKRLACAARAACIWHRKSAPPWARDLPVSDTDPLFDRQRNELTPRQQILRYFAYSLRWNDWEYEEHPVFPTYARGVMSYDFAPDELRNDPDLIKEFPPRPLAGIDIQMHYNTPENVAWRRRELLRELQDWHENGSLPPLREFTINRNARALACISDGT